MTERELRVATARFLREARHRDPEHYREVLKRHRVLSTFEIDSQKQGHGEWPGETDLLEAEDDERNGYRPGTLDRQIHREWLAATFQEAA